MFLDKDISEGNLTWLDFTKANEELMTIDFVNTASFSDYIFSKIPEGTMGIGGWLEERVLYARSEHFNGIEEPRTVHLGLDFWVAAYTAITCPREGIVHSFANNDNFGDYGPTIILEHPDEEFGTIYTLYGHLSPDSLNSLKKGQPIAKGQAFAAVGNFPENGNWPPHLHFQVMKSMEEREGDFPGVCAKGEVAYYKTVCLSPLDFLGIKKASA